MDNPQHKQQTPFLMMRNTERLYLFEPLLFFFLQNLYSTVPGLISLLLTVDFQLQLAQSRLLGLLLLLEEECSSFLGQFILSLLLILQMKQFCLEHV